MREFTEREKETLDFLGCFHPTVKETDCTIKGYMADGDYKDISKIYLSSPDLRALAEDLNSIAQWLDERATEAEQTK